MGHFFVWREREVLYEFLNLGYSICMENFELTMNLSYLYVIKWILKLRGIKINERRQEKVHFKYEHESYKVTTVLRKTDRDFTNGVLYFPD